MNSDVRQKSSEARAAIEAVSRDALTEEIEYRLDLQLDSEDYDGEPNYLLALLDAEEWAENTEQTALLNACRRALIRLGHYREISRGELARIQTLGGRKKYDFQLSGKRYVWVNQRNEEERP